MGLDLDHLRNLNVHRCVVDFNHPLDGWTVMEWGCATGGELGEAQNVAKKLGRIRDGLGVMNTDGLSSEQYREKLAEELADTVIYCDLWAASEGINLGAAIVTKFNADSEKRRVGTKFPPSTLES